MGGIQHSFSSGTKTRLLQLQMIYDTICQRKRYVIRNTIVGHYIRWGTLNCTRRSWWCASIVNETIVSRLFFGHQWNVVKIIDLIKNFKCYLNKCRLKCNLETRIFKHVYHIKITLQGHTRLHVNHTNHSKPRAKPRETTRNYTKPRKKSPQ